MGRPRIRLKPDSRRKAAWGRLQAAGAGGPRCIRLKPNPQRTGVALHSFPASRQEVSCLPSRLQQMQQLRRDLGAVGEQAVERSIDDVAVRGNPEPGPDAGVRAEDACGSRALPPVRRRARRARRRASRARARCATASPAAKRARWPPRPPTQRRRSSGVRQRRSIASGSAFQPAASSAAARCWSASRRRVCRFARAASTRASRRSRSSSIALRIRARASACAWRRIASTFACASPTIASHFCLRSASTRSRSPRVWWSMLNLPPHRSASRRAKLTCRRPEPFVPARIPAARGPCPPFTGVPSCCALRYSRLGRPGALMSPTPAAFAVAPRDPGRRRAVEVRDDEHERRERGRAARSSASVMRAATARGNEHERRVGARRRERGGLGATLRHAHLHPREPESGRAHFVAEIDGCWHHAVPVRRDG